MKTMIRRFAAAAVILVAACSASADEGMWLFNDLPREYLQQHYGFRPARAWAEHVMRASVRFNSGGSASFVSRNGLVLTNHHVGADTLQKISTAEHNYYRDGFYAKTLDEEIKTPDLELNQLVSVEDVTQRVNAAVTPGMSAGEAAVARRGVMSEIEKQSLDATGLRSDVVTLYGGARYHLYRYKKYTDVRLVWAPESTIAFFGGDADNFEYPRYCLDVCLFRVYEDGKPARIEHFLKFSQQGAAEGELVFVSGNPGRTQRISTVSELKHERDVHMPFVLDYLRRREILLQQFSLEGEEEQRRARDDLLGIQNSRKAYTGMLRGLQDPALLARKQADEETLRKHVDQEPRFQKYAGVWRTIEEIASRRAELLRESAGFSGRYYAIGEQLVFMAAEDQKPSAERLREYRESNRESLLQQLLSGAPIHDDLERLILADSLALFVERRGGDHPLVQAVLAGKSPQARAAELIAGTRLGDVAVRKALATGGPAAVDASNDPMIRMVKVMEAESRRLRKIREESAEQQRQAYAQIAEVLFAVQGTSAYPDATFTLRLAFGPVRGYLENGQAVAPWTTIGGAFDHEKRHAAKDPWKLPARWHERRERLNLDTPFNFVCTADIIGGNSGSPVINRDAELVGVIFDGNIQSLTGDFLYSEAQARAVAVHSSAIRESLRVIYDAAPLADELGH